MSKIPASHLLRSIGDIGPHYIPHEGVVYGIDAEYGDSDPRHLWASATCVPLHDSLANAQASAEDISFMLSGYTEAVILLTRIAQTGVTPDTLREIRILLLGDEQHAFRYSNSSDDVRQ